jgi:small-conductance mechanosensitive channel
MSGFWQRMVIAAVVIVAALVAAKAVDLVIGRRDLPPEAITRYRVLRRSIVSAIVFVGILSALLVIPQVRAIAGGVLASSAVLALIVGLASQRTLGNFVAGILIAFTQPVRLGDEVQVEGGRGVVEEIGLTYTWIRTPENDRLVVPNEKLASVTIVNSTIRSARTLVEVTVQVPATADLRRTMEALRAGGDEVYVTDLTDIAKLTVRRWVERERTAEAAASDLRLDLADRLRAAGAGQ